MDSGKVMREYHLKMIFHYFALLAGLVAILYPQI